MTRLNYSDFKSFGSRSKHREIGPKPIGIGLCLFVGNASGIFGLVSCSFGAELGPKSRISDRIMLVFRAVLVQPRRSHNTKLGECLEPLRRRLTFNGG
jgi:hypothetical protein